MRAMKLRRRKLEASEEKRFWRQVVLKYIISSHHQKQDHQELKIIRS